MVALLVWLARSFRCDGVDKTTSFDQFDNPPLLSIAKNRTESPPPRKWHTAVVLTFEGESRMVVFGGANLKNQNGTHTPCVEACFPVDPQGVLWSMIYNSSGVYWEKHVLMGGPDPRYWHSAVVKDNSMFIFGGVDTQTIGKGGITSGLYRLSGTR